MATDKPDTPKVDAMDAFLAWVHEGPKLAKAANLYVGIKIYPSEEAARARRLTHQEKNNG